MNIIFFFNELWSYFEYKPRPISPPPWNFMGKKCAAYTHVNTVYSLYKLTFTSLAKCFDIIPSFYSRLEIIFLYYFILLYAFFSSLFFLFPLLFTRLVSPIAGNGSRKFPQTPNKAAVPDVQTLSPQKRTCHVIPSFTPSSVTWIFDPSSLWDT
jgi:hypothetical protein